jgi:hypothetical protein
MRLEERGTRMRRLLVFAALVASAIVTSASIGVSSALACDTSYWTVGCQFYSPSEGHTITQFGGCCQMSIYTTFDTYSTDKAIETTAGGSWISADVMYYGWTDHVYAYDGDDKLGCYNQNSGTMYVNCRVYSGWG